VGGRQAPGDATLSTGSWRVGIVVVPCRDRGAKTCSCSLLAPIDGPMNTVTNRDGSIALVGVMHLLVRP